MKSSPTRTPGSPLLVEAMSSLNDRESISERAAL
jgi:hypothetical protein